MSRVIIVTGASSGFGRLTANALAKAGDIVYASMRETKGRNAAAVADVAKFSKDNGVDLRAIVIKPEYRGVLSCHNLLLPNR